jgi:AcrR family transcriptional regulator
MKNTREEILKAASKVFVEKGYEGASISEIAKLKGLNQSLIYHYFRDKKELWHRAKEYLLKEYIEASGSSIDMEADLPAFLMKFCKHGFEYLASHPDVVRILTWQRLEDKKGKLVEFKLTGREMFEKAFSQMQKKGKIRADLDPHLATVLIRSFIRAPFFEDFSKVNSNDYLKAIVDCIRRIIQP